MILAIFLTKFNRTCFWKKWIVGLKMAQFARFKEQLDPENLPYNTTISILEELWQIVSYSAGYWVILAIFLTKFDRTCFTKKWIVSLKIHQFVRFQEHLDPENLLYNTTISILGDSLTKNKLGDILGWSTVMKNEAFQSCIQQTTEGAHRENILWMNILNFPFVQQI